jgi:hypothetical protein
MTTTTIPADDDFNVARPIFNHDGVYGVEIMPVVAWPVEGRADSGRIIPVAFDGNVEEEIIGEDGVYAVQHPDGSFHFPDGERCASEDELLASFRKRLED